MSRVAEWLKSAGLGQFCSDFNNIDEDGFLALQVRLVDPQLVFLRFSASSRAVLGTGYVEESSKPECTCSNNFMRRRRPQRVSCTWSLPLSVTTQPTFCVIRIGRLDNVSLPRRLRWPAEVNRCRFCFISHHLLYCQFLKCVFSETCVSVY